MSKETQCRWLSYLIIWWFSSFPCISVITTGIRIGLWAFWVTILGHLGSPELARWGRRRARRSMAMIQRKPWSTCGTSWFHPQANGRLGERGNDGYARGNETGEVEFGGLRKEWDVWQLDLTIFLMGHWHSLAATKKTRATNSQPVFHPWLIQHTFGHQWCSSPGSVLRAWIEFFDRDMDHRISRSEFSKGGSCATQPKGGAVNWRITQILRELALLPCQLWGWWIRAIQYCEEHPRWLPKHNLKCPGQWNTHISFKVRIISHHKSMNQKRQLNTNYQHHLNHFHSFSTS